MYFLKGILPWQGLKVNKDEDRYKMILEKKRSTKPEDLCLGYPSKVYLIAGEFCTYINYTRNLLYEQDPDYEYLRGLFKTVMSNFKLDYDYKFDWVKTTDKHFNSSYSTLHPAAIVLNNLKEAQVKLR